MQHNLGRGKADYVGVLGPRSIFFSPGERPCRQPRQHHALTSGTCWSGCNQQTCPQRIQRERRPAKQRQNR